MVRYRIHISLFLLFCCFSFPARSGVSVVQGLSFGSFISKNNDAQYDITVNTNGSYSYDAAGFILISIPNPGVYDIDGLMISTAITSVDVTQNAPLSAPGNSLQMLNFTETHPGSTDASGVARIEIGATARTTGSGTLYPDQTYTGVVEIQINY